MAKGRASAQSLKRDPLMAQYLATSAWVKSVRADREMVGDRGGADRARRARPGGSFEPREERR